MKYTKTLGVGLLLGVLALTGCKEKISSPAAKTKNELATTEFEHVHGKGPNGGVVFDLGRYHAEFTVDHDKKECTILILGSDEKTPVPVAAKELTLTTKLTKTKDGKVVPAMTIKLLPKDESAGKAARFVGTDPGLGNVADFAGTVVGEINGKPSQGEFKEEGNDGHKNEKK